MDGKRAEPLAVGVRGETPVQGRVGSQHRPELCTRPPARPGSPRAVPAKRSKRLTVRSGSCGCATPTSTVVGRRVDGQLLEPGQRQPAVAPLQQRRPTVRYLQQRLDANARQRRTLAAAPVHVRAAVLNDVDDRTRRSRLPLRQPAYRVVTLRLRATTSTADSAADRWRCRPDGCRREGPAPRPPRAASCVDSEVPLISDRWTDTISVAPAAAAFSLRPSEQRRQGSGATM